VQVLLTSSGRVRIGSLGLADSLAAPPSSRDELQQQQREDLAVRGAAPLRCAPLSMAAFRCCVLPTSTHFKHRTTPRACGETQ
jgi:hypothetical protein